MGNFVEELSRRVGSSWPNIDEAARRTVALRKQLTVLEDFSSEDASVVVFGSVGRGEVTEASDVDWTLLIDGPSDPNHAHLVATIRQRLEDLELENVKKSGLLSELTLRFGVF